MFICAEGDKENAAAADRLYEAASKPKDILIIKGSKEHGTFIFEKEPENARILEETIISFFKNN